MPPEKADAIARTIELIDERDFDQLAEILHPSYEFHAAIGRVEGATYIGLDGLREFVADMDATWQDYRLRLEHVYEAGEQSVAVIYISGVARVSGVPLEQRIASVLSWRDGKVWRNVSYTAPDEALKAVGL